jgi:hypothetical protein
MPIGTRKHTEENGAINLIRDIEARCNVDGIGKPAAIIGHDRHRSFEPVNVRGISAAVCPCWQFSTYYGFRWPFTNVNIGGLLWDVPSNKIEVVKYAKEQRARRVGRSAGEGSRVEGQKRVTRSH